MEKKENLGRLAFSFCFPVCCCYQGEIKNGSIYIYEAEEEKAVQTLKHEVVDHIITSRIVKPLVDLINLLIKAREAEIYREKEKFVEMFLRLLS